MFRPVQAPLLAAAMWMAAMGLFAQAPSPEPRRPLHVITSNCSGKAQPGSPSVMLNELDASLGANGVIHLLFEGRHWSNELRPSAFVADRLIPAASSSLSFLGTPIKFRNGAFWRRDDKRVQRWESERGWTTVLQTAKASQDFEITYQGSVVLIGMESNLLAVYEPNGEEPIHQVSYPELGIPPQQAADLSFYWTRVKTASIDQSLLIYFAGCGRMFLFSAPERSLKEVDTPWQPFNPKEASKTIRDGAVNLSGHPSLLCIQWIPVPPSSVRIAYQCPKVEATLRYATDGRVEFFSTKRIPSESDLLQCFDLDARSGAKGERAPQPELKFPLWINSHGSLVPLASVFQEGGKPASSGRGQ